MSCSPLLRDPSNRLWAMGVTDFGGLTLTFVPFNVLVQSNPILSDTHGQQSMWQLSASIYGNIIATRIFSLPTIRQDNLAYIPLASPSGFNFKTTILPSGQLQSTSTSILFPDIIPYIPDVTMSIFGQYQPPVTCPVCNNALITVSGDMSCWCCTCSSFILPEDTTITVVLSE